MDDSNSDGGHSQSTRSIPTRSVYATFSITFDGFRVMLARLRSDVLVA